MFGNMGMINRLWKAGLIGLALAGSASGRELITVEPNSSLEGRVEVEVIPLPRGERIGMPEIQGNDLELPNGDLLKSKRSSYNDGKGLFYIDGEAQIIDRGRGRNLKIGYADPKNQRAYLFFDGNVHPEFNEPYISFGDKENFFLFSTGSPKGKIAPTVEFLEGNKYGRVEIDRNDKFIVQARGGHVTVRNRVHSMRNPKVITEGYFYVVVGDKIVGYVDGMKEPYIYPNAKINGKELKGFSSSPMQLEFYDKGKRLLKGGDLFVTDNNQIDRVSVKYEGKLASVGVKGNPVSSWLGFYDLSLNEQRKFAGLSASNQWNLIQHPRDYIRGFLGGYQSRTQTPVPVQRTQVRVDVQRDRNQRDVPQTSGYIAVHPSVVRYWKVHKQIELRRQTGRRIIVDPGIRGVDRDGFLYVSPGLVGEWQKYKSFEIQMRNPSLRGQQIIVEPWMKRPE